MELLQDLLAQLPALIQSGGLVPALLLTGAGTTIFLMADNGAQGFSVLNGFFVIVGYITGLLVTLIGLFLLWDVIGPLVPAAPAEG